MIRIELRRSRLSPSPVLALRRLGWLGAMLAAATVALAAIVAGSLLFGKTLLWASAVWWLWPRVFSAEFTQWVFGAASVSFWKVLLLVALIEAVRKASRRRRMN